MFKVGPFLNVFFEVPLCEVQSYEMRSFYVESFEVYLFTGTVQRDSAAKSGISR
jgi:hypothetical protein